MVVDQLLKPDCQVLLHPVAGSPAHDAAVMQIEDDAEIAPAFCSPDTGDVACPLTISSIGGEITVQSVCRDTEAMVAVSCNLAPARANWLDPVDLHQSSDPVLADVEPHLQVAAAPASCSKVSRNSE